MLHQMITSITESAVQLKMQGSKLLRLHIWSKLVLLFMTYWHEHPNAIFWHTIVLGWWKRTSLSNNNNRLN